MYSSIPTMRSAWLGGYKRSRTLSTTLSSHVPVHTVRTSSCFVHQPVTIIPSISSSSSFSLSRRFFTSTAPPVDNKEKIGPELPTEKGLAAEQGQLPRRWIDEPVPASSLSAVQEFPGLPPRIAVTKSAPPKVQISTLSNGLRIATQDNYGQVSTFAMFIDAGSMYENDQELGTCHFLETTAFKSTRNRSAADVLEYQARNGMASAAVFNREVVMYKVDTLRKNTDTAINFLAEAIINASLTDEEMHNARQIIAYQRDEALSQPQILVSEHLYTAAYGQNTPLGRPEKCSDDRVNLITADTLRTYMNKYFTASRMVLAGVNVDHDLAVKTAEKAFNALRVSSNVPGTVIGRVKSPYIGGDVRSSPDWSAVPITAAAAQAASKTEFTHIMMALPTVGWSHDDVVPVCVVDTLLGGGSSFSAGGPGKGMYSRLYRDVLNKHSWVESANAFSAQLYDNGIVGIYGAAPGEYAGNITSILAGHLLLLCEQPVKNEELLRSANQLASSVLMNLETRGLLAEDIGRQILSHGKRLDPTELVHRIRAVTKDDIVRVMRTALSHPPSFAAVGDVSSIAAYDQIREYIERVSQRWKFVPGSTPSKLIKT